VALLGALLKGAAGAADLHGELLALGVTHKLAGGLLNILGGTGGLVYCLADLSTLTVAFLQGKIFLNIF
jgi:hypothetical protein